MELKGKPLTLASKVVAALVAFSGLLAKVFVDPELEIDAFIKVGAFIAGLFVTVDVSLWLENIFVKRGP